MNTLWSQYQISLKPRSRGCHLITDEVLAALTELRQYKVGIANLFLCHTSASLTINENADSTVRSDMNAYLNHLVPEDIPYFQHTYEGPDDMPAHIKSSMLGVNLTVPIRQGQLALGTWQGIYLCEHRNNGGTRKLIVTLNGVS
ncbi:secondary thiamine-phosphate synthase enzyme YjbQ [Neptunicella sp. SCSIO 80796]|uniref:secondary thiamine-phosphate synthase enzyme YjbQ n=1 Tax=Neptunicella plasticusilytica TaxID=3117012 RepID=UPI003A4D8354